MNFLYFSYFPGLSLLIPRSSSRRTSYFYTLFLLASRHRSLQFKFSVCSSKESIPPVETIGPIDGAKARERAKALSQSLRRRHPYCCVTYKYFMVVKIKLFHRLTILLNIREREKQFY